MGEMVELLAGERQKSETSRAIQACNDWLRMGPGRSLAQLARQYTETSQNVPPTRSKATLKSWSERYGWAQRGEVYDVQLEAEKNARRRQALEEGLALDYERVIKLKELAGLLFEQLYERDADGKLYNLWVPDVKSVGSGDHVEIVDIERFNGSLLTQLRGTLDDLAAETGGRVKKADVTSGGEPFGIKIVDVFGDKRDSDSTEDASES